MHSETVFERNRYPSALSACVAVLLCLCTFLTVMLEAVPAAFGESAGSTWEERLEAAREKYNADTVNVYRKYHGRYRKGKINVCFYSSRKQHYANINIRESLQITDEAEMQAILEVIAQDPNYSEEGHGTIAFMKAQWIAHNLAHSMATGSDEQRALVSMVTGEKRLSKVISRAKELDLSPLESLSEQQIMLYELVIYVYGLNEH